jgi:hypothetical protein
MRPSRFKGEPSRLLGMGRFCLFTHGRHTRRRRRRSAQTLATAAHARPSRRYRNKQHDLQYYFLGGRDETRTELNYFSNEVVVKNCTVTLRPIGNDSGLPSRPITASRISRSLLSDGSPVEMLFLPIMVDILTTEPFSLFPSRASAWITTFCPIGQILLQIESAFCPRKAPGVRIAGARRHSTVGHTVISSLKAAGLRGRLAAWSAVTVEMHEVNLFKLFRMRQITHPTIGRLSAKSAPMPKVDFREEVAKRRSCRTS